MRKIILVLALLISHQALAVPLTPGEFGAVFEIFNPATSTVQYAYDDVTDTFSMNGNVGSLAQGAVLDHLPLDPFAPFARPPQILI